MNGDMKYKRLMILYLGMILNAPLNGLKKRLLWNLIMLPITITFSITFARNNKINKAVEMLLQEPLNLKADV